MIGSLAFSAPLTLAALAALPALYWLLKVTPPRPRRVDFPPLRILLDLLPEKETVARTPWWLLALRLGVAAALILALAAPVWNARRAVISSDGPLLLIIDNGWPSAPDWRQRVAAAEQTLVSAQARGRAVALVATADLAQEPSLGDAGQALEKLRGLQPQPHLPERGAHAGRIAQFLDRQPDMGVVWIADGLSTQSPDPLMAELAKRTSGRTIEISRQPTVATRALAGVDNGASGLNVRVLRADLAARGEALLRALDKKGLPLGEGRASFKNEELETTAPIDLPLELRNQVARVEILDEASAGAVSLLDGSQRRRRVAVVSGGTTDTSQPLLAPTYYLTRALSPFAEVREGRGGPAEALASLLPEKPSVVILADVGALTGQAHDDLQRFVEEGGVLIRFAGTRLAAANDDLVPVRLRRGGRTLGGTLSWETPKTLAPFGDQSPFKTLKPPAEVSVTRQILAEPDLSLAPRTWAALSDGTPVVTGETRGKGAIALFHVTADTSWSSLPLSGLFVDMMRTLVNMSPAAVDATRTATTTSNAATNATLPPLRTLDGEGRFRAPPATAKPAPVNYAEHATADYPPGFYGSADDPLAVNALRFGDKIATLESAPAGVATSTIETVRPIDLRPWLLVAALIGLILDTIATLWLSGAFARVRRPAVAAALVALAMIAAAPRNDAFAQTPPAAPSQTTPAPIPKRDIDAALVTRLAYVVTGDSAADEASRAGLYGLTQALTARTALDPGEPVGVDLDRDDLSVFPLLYWPIVAGRPAPIEAQIRKLDAFMKNGGTVLFDTRDSLSSRPGSQTPENQLLRKILGGLDIPELEPVPRDHVITKAFYLIDHFPGRYDGGQTWIEALPPAAEDGRRPARAGDGVSPIIITGNDLAAAWATNRRGEPLYPISGSDNRQREMALRGGVNIVLYVLTGNYKADQVHVPALLERLGQ
ncbi:DUF4159 domain-containing protein [Terrarubrum flagellatum]|uniref:DUF4159 domain-containing protein n=1 Tax=Terrirubrum flagellatum TaxID=2895980 RepID=UPI0031450F78